MGTRTWIEPLEGMIAISTGSDHRLDPGISPGFDIVLGCFSIMRTISHVVGSSTATRFIFSHYADIHTGTLENVNRGLRYLS